MGDKKLFDIDEFWKDLKLDKYGIEDIDEFEIDEIGKKIEESLNLEEFEAMEDKIEMPSPETFAKWVELGEDKYRKRVRRKRILGVCATFLIICIGALVAINCIKPPVVDAGLEGGIQIDDSMERTTTYNEWSDLPVDIQETFIEIKELPEGYEIEKIEVREGMNGSKVELYLSNGKPAFTIREYINADGSMPNYVVADKNKTININGVDIYMEEDSAVKTKTYKFLVGNIVVDIITPIELDQNSIESIINAALM